MKNIFLGALPVDQTVFDPNGESYPNGEAPVKSPFVPYPVKEIDKPIALDETANGGTGTDEGKDTGADVGDGVNNEDAGNGNAGSGDGETKSAINIPVVIGAAALIYFLFLRKK
jgi:hypothetical protein